MFTFINPGKTLAPKGDKEDIANWTHLTHR